MVHRKLLPPGGKIPNKRSIQSHSHAAQDALAAPAAAF